MDNITYSHKEYIRMLDDVAKYEKHATSLSENHIMNAGEFPKRVYTFTILEPTLIEQVKTQKENTDTIESDNVVEAIDLN